jgi:hypothetical protein
MTKEQIDLLLQRGHITPDTANRMVQHYADGGVVAMPLKQEQPTLEQSVSEMSPIAGAGFGLVKNLFFDQRPPGEFEPGGGGITESISPIDLITPSMVAAPAKALAPKLGQGLKALGKEVVKKASDPTGAIEIGIGKKQVLPLYHATDEAFATFDLGKAGTKTDPGLLGKGIYFSTDPKVQGSKKFLLDVDAKVKNPLRLQYPKWGADKKKIITEALGIDGGASSDEITAALKSAGHDSVILDYSPVKYPNQEIMIPETSGLKIKNPPTEKAAPLPMDEASRMARAQEQGYQDRPYFHETSGQNIEGIAASGFDPKRATHSKDDYLMPYGVFVKSTPETIGVAQEATTQMPVRIRVDDLKTKYFSNRDELEGFLSKESQEFAKNAQIIKNAELEHQKKFDSVWNNRSMERGERKKQLNAIMDEWNKGESELIELAKKNRQIATDLFKEKGYEAARIVSDVGGFNKKTDATIVFDPTRIRSEFAAFDPKKIKSSDILAGVGGVGILGGASQAQAQEGKNMFNKEQADMMLQRGLITPQTYQRITGAQGYAEGGEVMPAPVPSPIPDIPVAPIDVNVGAPIPEALASAPMPAVPMAGPTPVPAMTPAGAAGVPLPGQYGPPSPMAQTPPATERAITPGVPGGVPAFQMPGEASMMKAAGLETQAAKQVADAAQASYDNLQAQLEKERNTYATIQNDIQGRLKTLDGEMMAGKVDPNRLWSEASTGAKIGAVIGMLFSGIGAGVTGKENMAIANLNRMIDRDVEAQKANIQNKQNLFSKYMAQLGDTRQAEAATRLHLLQGADVELKKAQAKAATPQAQAAFEKTKAQLEQQKAAYTIELTKMMGNASLYGMGGAEGGIPFGRESFYQASDPELQKRIVPVADKQRSYLARTDGEAAELRKMESAYTKARGMLNTLKQYSSLGSRISPSDRAKADALVAKLPPLLNELNGYARFTEMEAELLEKTFTSPGVLNAIFAPNTKTNALLKDLETQMQNKRAIMLQGYKPVTSFEPGAR